MDAELQAPEKFILCNDEKCSTVFKYLDLSVHTVVDGPDPRDHLANERNLLTWIRTGTTLALIGFITLLDFSTKNFAPSYSFPWANEPKTMNSKIISYIFVGLGFICFIYSLYSYFKNQRQIVKRLLWVGQGWMGYLVATLIMIFVVFIMIMALTELPTPS
ncbi:uncharacterized protein BX663DRAFT_491065 [Cokeromyces recurvatus]|uniref:uncharacterized protein n=1 Tax=Cokeromyces recurvatus TaxID=90255 RepID=UPI00221EAE72|nr:uncharacterized protein BX663DRAFT_491065 [Cokeromyces recurvatus]KAI7907483.1 hypothetical protein BX663DRAFT_491065 [Cokeromyces recurvatus]